MVQKVNIKARIDRHSRVIKDNFGVKSKFITILNNKNFGYKIVIISVVFLMPIYPIFASLVHNNTEYDFYRGYIDESSILGSYYSEQTDEIESGESLYEAKDAFFSVSTILDDDRDLSGTNEIVEYKVRSGDSISSIAYNFRVSNNSIYWANDFSKNHVIHPGDTIKIPPISGVIHQIQKGDTISSIAKKYSIESEKIIEQNLLTVGEGVTVGEVLVIPGAIKQSPKPKYIAPTKTYTKTTKDTTGYSFAQNAKSQYVNTTGSFKLVWRKPQHTFYWGNCTWYVAQYKNVNWGGNANAWLKNAQAKGHATGSNPSLGSIVVFNGRGYNPKYGHVGIVMDVKSDHIIVSDMNYRRLNEVTYRKIPIADRAIMGYIYVE